MGMIVPSCSVFDSADAHGIAMGGISVTCFATRPGEQLSNVRSQVSVEVRKHSILFLGKLHPSRSRINNPLGTQARRLHVPKQ
jgi:hypothetical protein